MNTETKKENAIIQPPYILYADDDLDDQAFVTEMLRRVNQNITLKCFMNGLELVQYLESLRENAVLPACIVLDLNMPVWDGIQTLKVLMAQNSYKDIPTFIFSTSSSERDMALADSIGAVAYITKPYGQKELLEVCQEFAEYCAREPRIKTHQVSTQS